MKRFLLLSVLTAFVFGTTLPSVEAAPAKAKHTVSRAKSKAASNKKKRRHAKKAAKKHTRKARKKARH